MSVQEKYKLTKVKVKKEKFSAGLVRQHWQIPIPTDIPTPGKDKRD